MARKHCVRFPHSGVSGIWASTDRDHGEIRWILERGYQGFALMGPHRFFHLASDGPEVTNPNLPNQVAQAFMQTIPILTGR